MKHVEIVDSDSAILKIAINAERHGKDSASFFD